MWGSLRRVEAAKNGYARGGVRPAMAAGRWNLGWLAIVLAALIVPTTMVRDSDGPRRALVRSVFVSARPALDPFLVELEERTFRFFWETANPQNGLIPDR
ncbi:MAG TPA: hypothetical protein VFR50_03065, partial [Casimicrobiaceae bacterium]|nr:hypothetical protein [Casimicrobiaceae bacterium]